MDVVFGHAARVLVLLRGQIIAAGTPDEIRAGSAGAARLSRRRARPGAAERAAPHERDALLDVGNLSAFYGRAQVLFDLSLQLHAGEVVALIGRNGAGKTTTLKAIMGLISATRRPMPPSRGTSLARAARLTRSPGSGSATCPRTGASSPTSPSTRTWRSGARTARAGRSPWTPERLFRLFPNLAEMRGRRGNQMSGGEQQMLAIARTLMGNPDAILLDEPSEGIAPVIVQMMAEAIRAMKAEGVAVLLSEQNWAFAAGIGDRACVIERGEIRFQGSMAELLADEALRAETLGV